ncbi:MAG: zinc metallopeptidase [Eubacteriales bacterium]|nr:zinc metallopeptidase [Eubacteriales bacterium]
MFYWDPTYILILPGLLLAMFAQYRVKSAFERGRKIRSAGGLTGEQAALRMLAEQGVFDVRVEDARGKLGDHYDPTTKTLRLSRDVRHSDSVAAIGVACHEAGHALQHAQGYGPLKLRTASVPAVNIGSNLAWPLFVVGLIVRWQPLLEAGIWLFALTVLFALVTLPVEFNASSRALRSVTETGVLTTGETAEARSVLNAAALTYVASAAMAILQLLRLLAIAGVGRRED